MSTSALPRPTARRGASAQRFFSFSMDVDWIPGSEIGVTRLYEFCGEEEIPATFFVTGLFARDYPEVLADAVPLGHELGTHGWRHGQLTADEEESFRTAPRDVQRRWLVDSTEAVRAATGVTPVAFRAPNLQVSETTFELLEALGYRYDSSVPARRISFSYGKLNPQGHFRAPLRPYVPSRTSLADPGEGSILEVPPSSYVVPINMSALRVLGFHAIAWAVRRVLAHSPVVVFYGHPAEFVEPERQKIPEGNPARHKEGIGPQNFAVLRRLVRFLRGLDLTPSTLAGIADAVGHRHVG